MLNPNQSHSFHNPSLRPRSEQHAACRQHRRRQERHVVKEMKMNEGEKGEQGEK